jgi:hypothetical protein
MTHKYKLFQNTEIYPGIYRSGFVAYFTTSRKEKLPKINLSIYTNHLISCYHCNYDYFTELKNKNIDKLLIPPNILVEQPFQPEIFIPKKSSLATYKYSFNINLDINDTFIFSGGTNFEKINVQFSSNSLCPIETYNYSLQSILPKK